MKEISRLLYAIPLILMLTTCRNHNYYEPYYSYYPILMDRTVMEGTLGYYAAQPIKEPGKIYVKGSYIFISEKYQGVHIIDNHIPTAPVKIGFFRVPGCVDMAIKDNVLYVDNAVDLVAITYDSNDWSKTIVSSRVRDILPELSPPEYNYIDWEFSKGNRKANTVIVGWIKKQ
jgi:hypothetical protein